MQQSFFYNPKINEPLANRVRPRNLNEFVGQTHLLGAGMPLLRMIEKDNIPSMIFWGPPGVGKTTLARIIASTTEAAFINFSAVTSGIKDIKDVMKSAEDKLFLGERTIVFVDEIHRFNKAQQDAFLPYVEKGSIILIGATTENPSFEVNSALLSRCKVFVLHALDKDDILKLLKNALSCPEAFEIKDIQVEEKYLAVIADFANGDARTALNTLEMLVINAPHDQGKPVICEELVKQCVQRKLLLYDKDAEEHYNLISALHKSMRDSDPDAALYWLARMLEAGEDPLYVARRIIRFASEDVGMADSSCLPLCIAAYQACHFLGMPECNVHLAHAVVRLALSPKSRALDDAYALAKQDAINSLSEPVPLHIRNAPTSLMKELGYSQGYQYNPGTTYNYSTMQCLPDSLLGKRYYLPTESGNEAAFKKAHEHIRKTKEQMKKGE